MRGTFHGGPGAFNKKESEQPLALIAARTWASARPQTLLAGAHPLP
jgi:hypothetical protein